MFAISVITLVGDGNSTSFWTDRWINGSSVPELAPALMPFVKRRGWRRRSVSDALQTGAWVRNIIGGLHVIAI